MTRFILSASAGIAVLGSASHAALLVYEPFDYPAGTLLQGADGGEGFDGPWEDHGSGGTLGSPPDAGHRIEADDDSLGNIWTGIPDGGLPNLGHFLMGERRDDNSGSRPIAPSVTETFVDGTITWMSYVSGHTNDGAQPDNHHKPNLAIGQGPLLDNRADNADGQAIGGGAHKSANGGGVLSATYWDDEDSSGDFEEHRSHGAGDNLPRIIPQQLIVMKIEWGTDGGSTDTVSMANFDISTTAGYTAPAEADFDAKAVSITSMNDLDQATFDTISFHGSRSNFDEIRLGTEFDDVVNGLAVGPAGLDPLAFTVESQGDELVFEWASQEGMLYTLRSNDDLQSEPESWSAVAPHESIVATPPRNTLTIPRPAAGRMFFVVEEFPPPPVTVFSDNFENGQGDWTTGGETGAGTVWEIGTPANAGPSTAHSPASCFGTNIAANYENDAVIWLRSPAIDLTAASGATLRFWQFTDIEEMFDFGGVRVLDATDDSVIEEFISGIDGMTDDWEEITRSLPEAALGKSIKIEFVFTSDDFGSFPQAGWYIDDVEVSIP